MRWRLFIIQPPLIAKQKLLPTANIRCPQFRDCSNYQDKVCGSVSYSRGWCGGHTAPLVFHPLIPPKNNILYAREMKRRQRKRLYEGAGPDDHSQIKNDAHIRDMKPVLVTGAQVAL
jgi:hypothetical protein